ncbi:MAG: HypC/HybG/HupF family hydrogenase formation chaperone [Bacteroidales bacterium]|nr:HypC/HybG/HupF family hydrogenase formation chaperone [Bacteroidales bacterium]
MCLAVPGEVISIDNSIPELRMAKVSIGGAIVDACVEWLPEAQLGDYVLVHVGMAISKIDKEAAAETLELFREMSDLLEAEDNKVA